MVGNTSWHLPRGPANWSIFVCSVLFCLAAAMMFLVIAPIGSKDWWIGFGCFVLGGASALGTLWELPGVRIRSRVAFDSEKVERTSSDGTASSVRWDDLQR